jgi:hypothetical protein
MAFSVAGEKLLQRAASAEAQGNRALAEQLRREAEIQANSDVFGIGYKTDKHGRPIESGIGSDSNITEQHIAAVRKYEGESAAQAVQARAERLKANK